MPFTFSHPAIVLPLGFLPRKYISITGLVAGSMAPDFEYFIRMKIQSDYSHTLAGLFWFDLPLSIMLAFVFHNIVRNSLFINLPKEISLRLNEFTNINWNMYFRAHWVIIIFSVLIGAASHLLWDSFTHFNGYFVELFQPMSNTISILGTALPVFKIVQHMSTVLGGIVIFIILYRLPKSNRDESSNPFFYWTIVFCVILTILIIRFGNGFNYREYGNIVVSCISALVIALIVAPLIFRMFSKIKS